MVFLQLSSHVVVEEAREGEVAGLEDLELGAAEVLLPYRVRAQPVQARLRQEEERRDLRARHRRLVQRGDQHVQAVCGRG